MEDDLLSTAAAAERLRVSTRRVLAMIASGLVRARKVGRDWVIRSAEVERVRRLHRRPGRPRRGS